MMKLSNRVMAAWAVVVFALLVSSVATARGRLIANGPAAGGGGAGGAVNLPYQVQDAQGTTWMLYGSGWLQQQGNLPMFSQAAILSINNNQPTMNVNQAKLDAKTGEVMFENMPCMNTSVTRRIKLDKDAGVARYIDIIKNTQAAEQTVQLMLQTNTNYGITSAQMVADPKRKENNVAWVAQTSGNRTVIELYSGKGAKQAFTINYQQGNSQVMANISLAIPAGREVAIMHFHTTAADPGSGVKWVQSLKEAQLMKDVPPAIRKLIVNFTNGQSFIGDYEILRGEIFDVIELRTGDQYRGTIREQSFKLTTFYGPVELPVEKVIGLINVGEYRPRQLVVTSDGEIFGGKLEKETIGIELSSGQVTQVPLAQINRLGYRKRAGEPEEWTFDKPLVLMRSGDRMGVRMPDFEIDVATRYGSLKLKPAAVAAIAFANDEHGIHEIYLSDGSKFAGLVTADHFDMKLSTSAAQTPVTFPSSAIARLQLNPKVEEPDGDNMPMMTLTNDDQLVGVLVGKLKLETAFDTLNVEAPQIKSLRHSKGSVQDVQITLWDETTVSGQLSETELTCNLRCGVTMKVPVALVEEYNQPSPQPSEAMVNKVKGLVAQLNADDWKARDRAETQLVGLGPMVVGTLKELRTSQTPEAQQRIDSVLKQLAKQVEQRGPAGGSGGGGGNVTPPPGGGAPDNPPPAALPQLQPPGIPLRDEKVDIDGPGR
jgi:hypothetical protein